MSLRLRVAPAHLELSDAASPASLYRALVSSIRYAAAVCPEHPTHLPHAWGRWVLTPAATYCSLLRLLQREADLQRHLVLDARCREPPALLLHLEPLHVAQRPLCPLDRPLDCIVVARSRRTDQRGQLVDVMLRVRHVAAPFLSPPPCRQGPCRSFPFQRLQHLPDR